MPAYLDEFGNIKAAVLEKPVLVGSGGTPETIGMVLNNADRGKVVFALKPHGDTNAPICSDRTISLF